MKLKFLVLVPMIILMLVFSNIQILYGQNDGTFYGVAFIGPDMVDNVAVTLRKEAIWKFTLR